jgi:hypothetical protein
MTDHRWTPSDVELTDALRVHYAAPSDPGYWATLEARILAHVAGDQVDGWWSQLEARNAYASVISAAPPSVQTAARTSSLIDGDATLDYMLSR